MLTSANPKFRPTPSTSTKPPRLSTHLSAWLLETDVPSISIIGLLAKTETCGLSEAVKSFIGTVLPGAAAPGLEELALGGS